MIFLNETCDSTLNLKIAEAIFIQRYTATADRIRYTHSASYYSFLINENSLFPYTNVYAWEQVGTNMTLWPLTQETKRISWW
jgi:hypothetical protein